MAERRKNYAEQLKDVRWQKKRLEILERDDYECQVCFAEDHRALHVHHKFYDRERMAWDYPDWSLESLCEECHKDAQFALADLYRLISRVPCRAIYRLMGYVKAVAIDEGYIGVASALTDDASARALENVYRLTPMSLNDHMKEGTVPKRMDLYAEFWGKWIDSRCEDRTE